MTRLISTPEIEEYFTIEACIDAMETMFEEMGAERAITNSREDVLTPVPDPPEEAADVAYHGLKSMGGSIPGLEVGAIRINSDILTWSRRDDTTVKKKVPAADGRYTGLVLVFSLRTGEPLAIFPDGVVQSYRVGATSALGASYLARDDASRLGMLGAGWQARAHLRAYDALFDLEQVAVYAPTPESRDEYASEMAAEVAPPVRAVSDPSQVVANADLVQTTTNSLSPVFDVDWVQPGSHIGVIRDTEAPDDFFDPDRFDAFAQSWSTITQLEEIGSQLNEREIPAKNVNNYVVEGSRPLPTFADRDMHSEPMCDWSKVPGLGAVVAGDASGRSSRDGVTAFYNRGMGIQFAAVGKVIVDLADAHDLGREIPTDLLTQDYHP